MFQHTDLFHVDPEQQASNHTILVPGISSHGSIADFFQMKHNLGFLLQYLTTHAHENSSPNSQTYQEKVLQSNVDFTEFSMASFSSNLALPPCSGYQTKAQRKESS